MSNLYSSKNSNVSQRFSIVNKGKCQLHRKWCVELSTWAKLQCSVDGCQILSSCLWQAMTERNEASYHVWGHLLDSKRCHLLICLPPSAHPFRFSSLYVTQSFSPFTHSGNYSVIIPVWEKHAFPCFFKPNWCFFFSWVSFVFLANVHLSISAVHKWMLWCL